MTADEIHSDNFRSAVAHAQRGVYVGIVSSVLAFVIAAGGAAPASVDIPILNLSINEKGSAVALLVAAYFVNGAFLSYSVDAAKRNLRKVENETIRAALKETPGIVLSSGIYRIFLYCLLVGTVAIVLHEAYGAPAYWAIPVGVVLASPYTAGMEAAKEIHSL